MKLRGWATWLSEQLSDQEAELAAFESVYDIRLGMVMRQVNDQLSPGKRIVNDVLKPMAIDSDPDLKRLTQDLIERRLRVAKLATQVKVFQDQCAQLSREQTRRADDARSS